MKSKLALPAPQPPVMPIGAGLRRATRLGYLSLGIFVATFGVWSAAATVGGAVISAGQFVSESNLKKIQHQNGGIVAEIRVRDGDLVGAGDLLVRLDDTLLKANLQVLVSQIDELLVRMARLDAERDGRPEIDFPAVLKARFAEAELAKAIEAETRLFTARATARQVSRAQFQERIGQLRSEIDGTTRQLRAKERESEFLARELDGVRALFKQNLVQITRLSQLERESAAMEGTRGSLAAQIEQSRRKIAENELNILQITDTLRAEVMKELRESQAKLAELAERRIAAEDQLRRVEIRAPVAGMIHQMSAHTVGGIIGPGEAVMMIVPANDQLTLEAKVLPTEYDQVLMGQPAIVRIHAFNQRTTPELNGTVSRIASDVVRDPQSGQTYYPIRIMIPRDQIERLAPYRIVAGMQAEVFLHTSERTPFAFLLKPLTDQFAKAFRER